MGKASRVKVLAGPDTLADQYPDRRCSSGINDSGSCTTFGEPMLDCLMLRVPLIFLAIAVGLSNAAHADFVPIALTSASYNEDMFVEKTAPAPVVAGGYTTASMDSGLGNSATSWYEQGYNGANPTTGLPPAGATFTHQSAANHRYTMAASYATNNAVLLDSTLTTATLTLTPSP